MKNRLLFLALACLAPAPTLTAGGLQVRGTELLDAAGEPFGNAAPDDAWFYGHARAILRLREAGFTHALMVDAANYGQDWQGVMLDRANDLFAIDPLKNVVFSVHMYEVFRVPLAVRLYFQAFRDTGRCLVVGEFADSHYGKEVAADAVLQLGDAWDIGYLGWSWSGNNPETAALDLVRD